MNGGHCFTSDDTNLFHLNKVITLESYSFVSIKGDPQVGKTGHVPASLKAPRTVLPIVLKFRFFQFTNHWPSGMVYIVCIFISGSNVLLVITEENRASRAIRRADDPVSALRRTSSISNTMLYPSRQHVLTKDS